jgi:hypothetical protein
VTWDVLVWFLTHWGTRYIASWIVCLTTMLVSWHVALDSMRDEKRVDGNYGHCTIDFGGQWLMGAMLVQGHGPDLYNRNVQREVLLAALPNGDGERNKQDALELMGWLMGSGNDNHDAALTVASCATLVGATSSLDASIWLTAARPEWTQERFDNVNVPRLGGPLYPPVNSFYMAPLALLPPRLAYRINQWLCIVWALVAGLGASYLSHGRFWSPLAATLVMVYPGYDGALHLAQNPPLTLAILVWGWALLVRGHAYLGGIVWGLLAFKPVWAAPFFLIAFITGRFRLCFSMMATGVLLAAATVPFVGLHNWLGWLSIGREASAVYNTDENWVFLSRDLLGIPRRWLLDFHLGYSERVEAAGLAPALIGWTLWLAVLEVTLLLVALRWQQSRQLTGPVAAFLLLAAWMNCFHFMYYDALLTALAFFVLFAEPRRYLEPILLAVTPLPIQQLDADAADYYRPRPAHAYPTPVPLLAVDHRHVVVLNRMVPTLLVVLLFVAHFFHIMDVGLTLTGFWSKYPNDVTATWAMQTGRETSQRQTGTVSGELHGGPLRITSRMYGGGQPWDTYVLMFLWLWCGWLWLRTPLRPAPTELPAAPAADVVLVPFPEEMPPDEARLSNQPAE